MKFLKAVWVIAFCGGRSLELGLWSRWLKYRDLNLGILHKGFGFSD